MFFAFLAEVGGRDDGFTPEWELLDVEILIKVPPPPPYFSGGLVWKREARCSESPLKGDPPEFYILWPGAFES